MPRYNHVSLFYNGTGQTLEYYPADAEVILDGPPTSAATYTGFAGTTSNDDTAEFGPTAATLSSVSGTILLATGSSQSNRRRIYPSTVTGINVGEKYVLANPQGQREVFRAASVNSSGTLYVDAEYDLSFDYAVSGSSTLKGLRHSFTIPAAFITDSAKINYYGSYSRPLPAEIELDTAGLAPPYRLRWHYTTGGGVVREAWTTFDVVRQSAGHNVTIQDLKELFPDAVWEEWIGQTGQHFQPQIDAAFERVKFDIRMAGYDPDAVRDPQVLDQLVLRCLLVTLAEAGLSPPGYSNREFRELSAANYQNMFNQAIGVALRTWIDSSGTGAVAPKPAVQLFLKR